MLKPICPLATEMSRLVGQTAAAYSSPAETLNLIELGSGTGITTLSLLTSRDNLSILSIDNEPTMQNQAKNHLKHWQDEGKLHFCGEDALNSINPYCF